MNSESKRTIRVLIAEDSPVIARVIATLLASDPQIEVVGTVNNGKAALDFVMAHRPDIVTMDIHMPVMDGYEATKQIMAHCPVPILIASAAVQADGIERMFRAVSYGALDLIDISELALGQDSAVGRKFIDSVKMLSRIKVVHHFLAKLEDRRLAAEMVEADCREVPQQRRSDKLLAIVASTGGPMAILTILKMLPSEISYGVVIVQHITSGFLEQFVVWLGGESHRKVKIARQGDVILPGVVYLAPCDLQMRIAEDGILQLTEEPLHDGHKPSATLLLESAARVYAGNAVAVILTGMGRDGARGMQAIRAAGGRTIAQDQASCVVFGMPKEAIDLGVIDCVCPLSSIAQEIVRIINQGGLG